ncbi:hypothetical protein CWI38_0128p0100 [Hamiltosporidium tvaerminnensis]|uniref:Uncharacterized protein n=1 Tax=Hamiltosporidium tvaerminnensis TaxID=1176355 RepID=A0A4Q9M3H5_9MICR|nr:hypothetical protein LUQ84_000573 [Hamiltosporidium tvaerminnensis]TBU20131.1 hypothetical protein CWI38_0128p0100 [Hamiltosporidium tvaerminnensis]
MKLESICKEDKVTTKNITLVLEYFNENKMNQTEINNIYMFLCKEWDIKICDQKMSNLIDLLMNSGFEVIYLNEIKIFLESYNIEMFKIYGELFKNCSGCYEAFGIKSVREGFTYNANIKEVESFTPVFKKYKNKNDKRNNRTDKKNIRNASKLNAMKKAKSLRNEKIEYAEKVKEMYRKAKSNN